MRKVCDIVGHTERESFYNDVAHHKVLGLEWDRGDEQHDTFVGVEIAEGEQYAIDRTRCTNGGPRVQ